MIAIVDTSTGAVLRYIRSTDGIDMAGCHTVPLPEGFDAVRPSHILVSGNWVANLAAEKAARVADVNDRAELIRGVYLTPGSGQAMTYLRKEDEARRFEPGGDPADTPFLWAEAQATGASLADTAALVLAQANAWATLGAAIEGHRRGLVVAIEAAADADALSEIDVETGWPGAGVSE